MLKEKLNIKKSEISPFLSATHFEMKSNKEVIIEGCRGILVYDENLIKIKAEKMVVSFYGKNLNVRCMTPDSMIIEGFITSIEFES